MKNLITTLVLITAVYGCKNSTVVTTDELCSFRGKLTLVGANGNPLSWQSGATIQVEGTAFSTTSDSAGEWGLDHVPAGIYNLMLWKPGFDTLIIPEYQFSGSGQ